MPCVFLSRPSSVLPCSSRHAYPAQAFPTKKRKKHAYRGLNIQDRSRWTQANIKMAVSENHASCWVQKDLGVCHDKEITGVVDSSEGVGWQKRIPARLTGIKRKCWMGTRLADSEVTASEAQSQSEIIISNRPELVASVLASRNTPVTKPMLYSLHPSDQAHALLVQQSNTPEGCEKMDRRRQKRDVNRSTRCRPFKFTGSHRRFPKNKNSRSHEVSGQSVYTNITGTFVLTATRELSDAGVEHISITATKKFIHEVDFALDTVGFRHDGSLVLTGATISELPPRHISTAILIAIVGGAVLLLSGVAYVGYQHQQQARQKDATTTNTESTVQYSALNVAAGGYSCSLHYNSHAGEGTSSNVVSIPL